MPFGRACRGVQHVSWLADWPIIQLMLYDQSNSHLINRPAHLRADLGLLFPIISGVM